MITVGWGFGISGWQIVCSLSENDRPYEALFSPANELFKPVQVIKNETKESKM